MKNTQNVFKVFTPSVRMFLGIAFLPAWALFLLPLLLPETKGALGEATQLVAWSFAMWAPGLGALIATRWREDQELKSLQLGKLGKKRVYIWAWAIPVLLVVATGLVTWGLGIGTFDAEFSIIEESISRMTQPRQLTAAQILGLQVVTSLFLAPIVNTVFALGEELGWRGFLLPRLLPLGQTKAMILTGVIWGVWHAPAVAQGLNYPDRPVLGMLMMLLFSTLFGIFLGWLYLKTKSPWAPALAHGSLNALAGLPLVFFLSLDTLWGGTVTSLTGLIIIAILLAILYGSKELPVLS
ncbi:MAG: CPBP family intramembrane metalloprotease [Anaerolineales bacterium]|nr:CPBP family intramembrane metalloprotease [Anaerolineales bacterium]MBS3752879.1 CPBP family intramembrane metalloprotease [Anaerolineales bacterium]